MFSYETRQKHTLTEFLILTALGRAVPVRMAVRLITAITLEMDISNKPASAAI